MPLTAIGIFVPGQPVTLTATLLAVSPGAGVPSGTATFTVDGHAPSGATLPGGTPSNGTVTLGPNGQGLLVLNNLPTSQHRIGVSYLGDTNFKPVSSTGSASSPFLNINVVKGMATIQVAANPLSSSYGQTVALTATVSGPVVPGGTVSFYNGPAVQTDLIGRTTSLDANGQATINYAGLTAGARTITVFYSGNTSYNSGLTTFAYTVNKATTETALTSLVSTTAYGQALNLTASLSVDLPGQGVPAGTVTFYDSTNTPATQLGNPVFVNSGGIAVLSITTLGVGQHTIYAKYNGNTNFAASLPSNTLTQSVQVGVLVLVTSNSTPNPNQSVSGQTLSLTATIKGQAPGNPLPPDGEAVTFTDTTTSTVLGTVNTGNTSVHGSVVHGTAVLTGVTGLSVGTHVISASYVGDSSSGGSFLPNTGQFTPTVTKDATTTTVTSSGNPPAATPIYGADVTFTVTVTAKSPGSGTPTGGVNFYDGPVVNGKILNVGGPVGLTNGVATFDTTALNAGLHTIYASYADDQNFAPSFGTVNQTINRDTTTTVLSETSPPSAPNNALYSVPVTLSATVTANSTGNLVPTGSVTFTDGGRTLGSANVNASGMTPGIAILVVSNLAVGGHTLLATYATSTNFLTSPSNSVGLNVAKDDTGTTVTTSLTPSYVGQAVTFTATVGAANSGTITPTGTVAFYDGAVNSTGFLGNATLATNGKATFTPTTAHPLPFGHNQTINANYLGDGKDFNPSTGSVTQDVLYNTGIAVTSSTAAPVYGQDFTFTATLTNKTNGNSGQFSGNVTFSDGSTLLGSVPVSFFGKSITATLANSACPRRCPPALTASPPSTSTTQASATSSASAPRRRCPRRSPRTARRPPSPARLARPPRPTRRPTARR